MMDRKKVLNRGGRCVKLAFFFFYTLIQYTLSSPPPLYMLRSIIRQAASPLVRSNFTRRTLHSSPVSFSDALFVVKKRQKYLNIFVILMSVISITFLLYSTVIQTKTMPTLLLNSMNRTKLAFLKF